MTGAPTIDLSSGYVSCTDTAKLVRYALKNAFPGTRFSVRSSSYAGGASIRVTWTDGPTDSAVDAVVGGFSGSNFDGMIDMAHDNSSWLEEDGTAHVAHSPGTGGQRGSAPEVIQSPRTPGAKLVHFLADYIFTEREFSPEFLAKVEATLDRPFFGQCRSCGGLADQDGFVVTTLHRGYKSERGACVKHAARVHASSVNAADLEVSA